MNDDKLYINGINGVTGEYLVPPLEYSQAVALIKGEPLDPVMIKYLDKITEVFEKPHLGLPLGVDPSDVKQAGWAVVFHVDEDESVQKALEPLIEHRRQQIGDDSKIKVLKYRTGESRAKWLARYGTSAGTVDPTKVPYYLLFVGNPALIPFSFIHLVDVEYAVGCLHFDTVSDYARYVASLIEYETGQSVPNSREAVFFAPRHSFDKATQLSADLLVNPLTDGVLPGQTGVAERWRFQTRKIWGEDATKGALIETLTSDSSKKPPAFLFTASHGMAFPNGDPNQIQKQGALLCQDWPGIGSIDKEHYFSAADIPAKGRVHGMIAFHFACYGAGTPSNDRFFHKPGESPPFIAPYPFIAALPKALLTHPQGGALACIGHVERAWGCSFKIRKVGPQILPFENAIGRILLGEPVGHAMKDFNERYASLSTTLSSKLEEIGFGEEISDEDLAADWIERNDAEGYIIIGDPAVRLRINSLE
jgi:hypothetical protein